MNLTNDIMNKTIHIVNNLGDYTRDELKNFKLFLLETVKKYR